MDHDELFVTVGHRKKNYGPAKSEKRGFQEANVLAIIEHPNWKPQLLTGDIALLKLDKDLILRPASYPACLPPLQFDLDKNIDSDEPAVCVISGWGATQGDGDNNYLLHATVPIIRNTGK